MKNLIVMMLILVGLTSCDKFLTGNLIGVISYSPEEVHVEIEDVMDEIIPAKQIMNYRLRDDRVMFITSKVDTYIIINADSVVLKADVRTIHYPKSGKFELIGEPEIH